MDVQLDPPDLSGLRLNIPQETLDRHRYLTPEQWSRLLAAYNEALTRYAQQQLDIGREVVLAEALRVVPLPWRRTQIELPTAQRLEIEQNVQETAARLEALPAPLQSLLETAFDSHAGARRRRQAGAGCVIAIVVFWAVVTAIVSIRGG